MRTNLVIKAGKSFCSNIRNLTRGNITEESANLTSKLERSPVSDVMNLSKARPVNLNIKSPEVNSKVSEFISILKLRNPQQIADNDRYTKILEHILNNPNYKSEEDILTHLQYLVSLAGKKAPSGKYLLDGKTLNYLADFKTNGLSNKQLREFADLIKCGERGLVPPNALQKFNIANGVNPEILKDIEKLKLADAKGLNPIDVFIPEFDSILKNADEISKLKPGDLYSIKKGFNSGKPELYLVTGKNSMSLIPMDRKTLFELMPPVKRFFIGQHGSGTCYQLSSYISMVNNPKFMSTLLKRIRTYNGNLIIKMPNNSTPNNLFAGKFDDFSSLGCVRTNLEHGKFVPKDSSQSVLSNPLVKAMENLYGKHRKYTYADEYVRYINKTGGNAKQAYNDALKNMDNYIYIKDDKGAWSVKTLKQINNEQIAEARKAGKASARTFSAVEDYYKESGLGNEVFDFFNKGYNKVDTHWSWGKNDTNTLSEIRKKLAVQNSINTFGTIPRKNGMELTLNANKDLYSSHAYSVVDYNPKTDVVTYINPWNSALTYEMKLNELAQYIKRISTCQ